MRHAHTCTCLAHSFFIGTEGNNLIPEARLRSRLRICPDNAWESLSLTIGLCTSIPPHDKPASAQPTDTHYSSHRAPRRPTPKLNKESFVGKPTAQRPSIHLIIIEKSLKCMGFVGKITTQRPSKNLIIKVYGIGGEIRGGSHGWHPINKPSAGIEPLACRGQGRWSITHWRFDGTQAHHFFDSKHD